MKKPVIIICCVVAAVVLWIIAASKFLPSNQEINAERLREDSIALQGNFSLVGSEYDYYQDIDKAVRDIRDLGDPLRFSADSVELFSSPQTAAIANYNIAKCDTVLSEVLPQWRRALAFTLHRQLNKEAQTIVRISHESKDASALEIYSLRYLSNDNIESDAREYNPTFRNLGFKTVFFAASPDSEGIEYAY